MSIGKGIAIASMWVAVAIIGTFGSLDGEIVGFVAFFAFLATALAFLVSLAD